MVATNYFSQICIGMLKHNMILGDSTTDNYLNTQLWYTHLLYQIWCIFIYTILNLFYEGWHFNCFILWGKTKYVFHL
jgi:hypothetical protein